ncbi:hypothetical protein BI343_06075 [Chromobacterium amazonense]|uniref:DUF2189 domain-containing protein n=1 Tax=Chromobacterium amazonense TaxID=1382803 RepID=A0A1S1WV49_9NEIS|nr:BPSS1780 family membrane protein [Chromobacterium amazonense]KIA79870.1 hypothetical protein QR66_13685 [Chromobacterium piscinae]MBM2885896.1 hypothetical protein [Chromobacterium amazonense]MDE1713761.1 BPSS1780 family membrane protein [Chromobacterium amazonense]OHX11138.1 hypothetical protein BI343_06075 [Chromobacterium amazonense]PRP72535.1 hypothetical protein BUE93_00425 [Chromobacterium amazonense]
MQSFDTPPPARKVGAGRGWRWCVEAFYIVREQPLTWVLLTLVYLMIHFVINLVPFIGGLIGAVIGPVFAGAFVMAARKSERGEELELGDLFAGFRLMPGPLLQVGAIFFALMAAAMLIVGMAGVSTGMMSGMASGHLAIDGKPAAAGGFVAVLLLMMSLVMFVVSLSYWFAPSLVALENVSPWQAILASLRAGLSNWLPMLVAGLVLGLLLIPAMLTLGLGLLLWCPIAFVTAYTSWKDVFGQPQPAAQL